MRVLAGFLYLIGLLERPQRDLASYALTAYKRAAQEGEFEIAWRFERDWDPACADQAYRRLGYRKFRDCPSP
jgi:uncharacterized protein (DUF2235 family)